MVFFAALSILFGYVFLPRIKNFLQENILRMFLRQFSPNQNVDRRIRGNMEAGEGVEPLTTSPSSPRAGGSEFDVFLSFRGEDTRKGFTGHLHDGLKERGISTFIDSEKLEEGEEINKLLEYIERSKIFVPIFSDCFAESKWCLKEVTKSMECGKEIIPVFFGVEPSDVRNQTGPFKSAFKYHQSNKKQDQEEVRKWREALEKVGNLTGFTLKDMNGDEAKLKRAVIERVSAKLNKMPFEVAKHPIGIETRVHDVKKMLEKGGNIDGVHVIGIQGMGGLGKTTIAKAVYNELADAFNGATCFISNVRENAGQPNGLVNLQKQFIGDVLKEKNTSLGDVAQGKIVIKDRASCKRILLILDDIDNIKQLDALAGGRDWFGSGSVIIITTRDEGVLLAHNVKQYEIYKPPELNKDQSRELFMLHAFKGELPQGEYIQLSNEFVLAAGGLPLTLEVIGSLLSSIKNVREWKDTLEKLKTIPHNEVQQRLMLSYDSLDDLEKNIFLDISCFSIIKEDATYMWEGCGWFPDAAVRTLVQRSLVKIIEIYMMDEKYEHFLMHDQIRDMGRAIVDEKCSRKLQKKSRLWDNQGTRHLLQRKGPETIDAEGIEISFYKNDCTVSAECFENMPNLRYLRANNVKFQGTFPCFPTDLKWLQLESCHFDSPPSDFNLEKLVILDLSDMPPILINQLSLGFKAFERLKVLSLSRVETKITLDFMNMPSLVKLKFENCLELTTIDESIGKLKNLAYLSTLDCRFLRKLPDSIWRLSSLEVLNIYGCFKISSFPERLGELGSLKKLGLSETCIKEVPDSICRLRSLEIIRLNGCTELCSIPEGLGDMKSLKEIDLSEASIPVIPDSIGQLTDLEQLFLCNSGKLRKLPDSICQLNLLKSLNLNGCLSLCSLPERIGDMEKLEKLILNNTKIEIIPDSICQLKLLKSLHLNECFSLCSLPERLGDMEKLKELILANTGIEIIPNSVGQLKLLKSLDLSGCLFLCSLPERLGDMEKLEELILVDTRIEIIPDSVCQLKLLKLLNLRGCLSLCTLPERLGDMEKLEKLILDNTIIEIIPDSVGHFKSLRLLSLQHCKFLKALPVSIRQLSSIQHCKFLKAINIIEFTGSSLVLLGLCDQTHKALKILHLNDAIIEELPDCVGRMEKLEKMRLECEMLKELPNWIVGYLENLTRLEVMSMHLKDLPDCIGSLKGLLVLSLKCESLKALPNSIGSLKRIWRLDLNCVNLEALPDAIGHLKKLAYLKVSSNSLEALPNSIGSLKRLRELELKCPNLEILPDSVGELEDLDHFEIVSHRLKYLPNSMERLQSLQKLHLHCNNFTAPPDFVRRLEKLQTFSFNSKKLKYLDAAIFQSLGRLRHLDLSGCENLEGMLAASIGQTDFARLSSLESLNLEDCKGLEYLPQLPSSLCSLLASGCTNLRKMSDISDLKGLRNLRLFGCKQLEDVPGLENISSNLEVLDLPDPCDFTGSYHFSHDFKIKLFKEMTFDNLKLFQMSGSLVPGPAKGRQQLQFIFPRLPFSWLRRAWLMLGLDKVPSPICIAIIADNMTVFEKIVEVDSDKVRLNLGKESIVNRGEGAQCYTIRVTMDVSQLQDVFVLLVDNRWYYWTTGTVSS